MGIFKKVFNFILGIFLTWLGFPSQTSVLESLCYQFVCEYPLTELPQGTCGYCHTASILLFILGIISIAIFVIGIIREIVKRNK